MTPGWRLARRLASVVVVICACLAAGQAAGAWRPPASSGRGRDVLRRAPAQTPGACLDGDYTLSDYAQTEPGQVEGVAWFALRGPYTCRLATQLNFVAQPGGNTAKPDLSLTAAVAGLRGNPAEIKIDAVLRPGVVVARSWRWANWCGKPGKFAFLARAGSTANFAWSTPSSTAPSCTSPTARSTLTRANISIPACTGADYRLGVNAGQGFVGQLLTIPGASLHDSSPCRLDASVTFAVQQQTATGWLDVPGIMNNPSHATIGAILSTGSPSGLPWAWGNWCGKSKKFRWLITNADHRATSEISIPPPCQASSSPSTLTLLYNSPGPKPPRLHRA
jgi:hypothetical protein